MININIMNFQTFDLNLLRVLDAMLHERNTTRVAERINLSQPAVSSALNRLRHALGNPLFVRAGNMMVPTPFAQSLQAPLRQALEQLEATLSGLADFDPALSTRRFRIFGSDYFSEVLMPRLVDLLATQAPGMRLQRLHQDPASFVRQLGEERIDFALMPPEETPGWVGRAVAFHSSVVVVASDGNDRLGRAGIAPGQVLPMDLFCDMPHVQFAPEGGTSSNEDEILARLGRRRRVVLTVPDFYSVGHTVAHGQLIATLPTRFALSLAERLGLATYQVPFEFPMIRLCLYWHSRYSDYPEHRWMRERILEALEPLDELHHPFRLAGA